MDIWEPISENEVAAYVNGKRPIGVSAARAYLAMLNHLSYPGAVDYEHLLDGNGTPAHFYYSSKHLDTSGYDSQKWVSLGVSVAISVNDVPDVNLPVLLKLRGLQEYEIQQVLGIITARTPQLPAMLDSVRQMSLAQLRKYSFGLPPHTVTRAVKWLTNIIQHGRYPNELTFQAAIDGLEDTDLP